MCTCVHSQLQFNAVGLTQLVLYFSIVSYCIVHTVARFRSPKKSNMCVWCQRQLEHLCTGQEKAPAKEPCGYPHENLNS